jgi:hypothetical protein
MSYFIPGNPEPNGVQAYIRSVLPENDTNSKVATLLPYIRTEQITDPLTAMQIGVESAEKGWYWSGRLAVDHDDSWYVKDHKWPNSQPVNCRIIRWDMRANAGHSLNSNIGIVWSDWGTGPDGKTQNRLFVSVFGCDHEWTGKNLGNCYTESECTKCGYAYRTDSSG